MRAIVAAILVGVMATAGEAAPKLDDKVAVANLDRYPATLKLGKNRKEVAPRKATVLKPKRYPITIEYWSGNTKTGWKKATIDSAGVYGMNYKKGQWAVNKLDKGSGKPKPQAPKPQVTRKPVTSGGTARRSSSNAVRARWAPLSRIAYAAANIYRFVRNEQDRDLVRALLLEARDKDKIDFDKWLKAENLPAGAKDAIRESLDDLSKLDKDDWKAIDDATDKDWKDAEAELGDLVDDKEFDEIAKDLGDINTDDFFEDADGEVDLDDLEIVEDLDFGDDFDVGDDLDVGDDYEVDELDIDEDNYDLGDYDDFGDDFDDDWGDDDWDDDAGFDFFD